MQKLYPLKNPGFEGPNGDGAWHRQMNDGQEYGNIYIPVEWTGYFRRGPVPWDPSNDQGFRQPEVNVIPAEGQYMDPVVRVARGRWGLQFFGFFGAVDGGIYQMIPTEPRDVIKVQIHAHAWGSNADDPTHSQTRGDLSEQMRFWIGFGLSGETDPWSEDIEWEGPFFAYDKFRDLAAEAYAEGEATTVFLRFQSKYPLKHNDFYCDDVELVVHRADKSECDPRDAYQVKRGAVLPQQVPDGAGGMRLITRDEFQRAAGWAYDHNMQTVGTSPDDLMYGPGIEDVGVTVLMPVRSEDYVRDLEGFRDDHYPDAQIVNVIAWNDPDPGPEPGPGIVPEDQRNAPSSTDNFALGLHVSGFREDEAEIRQYIQSNHPPAVIKSINGYPLGMASRWLADEHQSSVLRVLRSVADNDAGWILEDDLEASATEWLDRYSYKLQETVRNSGAALGVSNEEELLLLLHQPVLESVNETISTPDPDLGRTVRFDVEFMKAVERRYGDLARAGILIAPIGNPRSTNAELERMLPAVRYACEARPKHLIAHHHAYYGHRAHGETYSGTVPGEERANTTLQKPPWCWFLQDDGTWLHYSGDPADPSGIDPLNVSYQSGLERWWPWLAGRWMVWWDYYATQHNLYFEHYAGEGGMLITPGDCGPGVLGGRGGWREGVSWDTVMDDLEDINRKWLGWNQERGWLGYGVSYFTHKWWGWESHWVLGGELLDWLDRLRA